MNRRRLPVIGFVVLAIVVAVFVTRPNGTEGPCLRLGFLDITASAPLFIAEEQGLFDHFGVCVAKEQFASSNELIDALAADGIDYVVEASAEPALALQLRVPSRFFITAASTISPEQPFDAVLVRDTSSIQELRDLGGRRISVFPGTTAATLLRDYLHSRGVDISGIEFVPTPPADQLASVRSGAVDAAYVYEPEWTLGLQDPNLRQLHGTVYGEQLSPNPQGVSLVSSAAWTRDPQPARALVAAFDSALVVMARDPERAREYLGSHFALPEDAVSRMNLLFMSPSTRIDWASVEAYAQLLVDLDELDGLPDVQGLRVPSF